MSTMKLTEKFSRAFGRAIPWRPTLPPVPEHCDLASVASILHEQARYLKANARGNLAALRLQLITEELAELAYALIAQDRLATLDALADLDVVVDGTWLELGYAAVRGQAGAEVFRSNMSKLGPDGKPTVHESGRIMKGPNYSPPRLDVLLNRADRAAELLEAAEGKDREADRLEAQYPGVRPGWVSTDVALARGAAFDFRARAHEVITGGEK